MRDYILPHIGQIIRRVEHARKFENATKNPLLAQKRKLFEILRRNENTVYGREHNFSGIDSIKEFQKQVPINTYETLSKYINLAKKGKPRVLTADTPLFFATTSGTTGTPKYIPITPSYAEEYLHGNLVWMYYAFKAHPNMFSGKILPIVSTVFDEYSEGEVPIGSITGYIFDTAPKIVKRYLAVPMEVYNLRNNPSKYYLLSRLTVEQDVTAVFTVNPGTILLLCDKIDEYKERIIKDIHDGTLDRELDIDYDLKNLIEKVIKPNPKRAKELESIIENNEGKLYPKDYWPDLALICCFKWGFAQLFIDQFSEYFADICIREPGLLTTEGRASVPLTDSGRTGVITITTHFFEYIPEDEIDSSEPTVLTCDQLQLDKNYYVLFTTSSGLYRYHINDIVRVVDYYNGTPVIEFVDRGENFISLTGEKLTEWQAIQATMNAARAAGVDIENFTVTYRWGSIPRYEFLVEFAREPSKEQKENLIAKIEQELCRLNIAYYKKRLVLQHLGSPVLCIVEPGSYKNLPKTELNRDMYDGQKKLKHLLKDDAFKKYLRVLDEVTMTD